jgi:hypothetical protein
MGPNQVWSWDITYLRAPVVGMFFYLYLFVDVWSRKIVAHAVHECEDSELASELFESVVSEQRLEGVELVLHQDNGSPMKGATLKATIERLGVIPSYSRPHVSDDNPYSESLFRTLKYRPHYPRKPFESLEEARRWVEDFVTWYNHEHLHSSIGFVTPLDRHDGNADAILAKRKAVYEQARQRHPERWSGKTRAWDAPMEVVLNPAKEAMSEEQRSHATAWTYEAATTLTSTVDRLTRVDILLIDELGYLNLHPEQTNIFFKLMDERYGKKEHDHHDQSRLRRMVRFSRQKTDGRCAARSPPPPLHHDSHRRRLPARPRLRRCLAPRPIRLTINASLGIASTRRRSARSCFSHIRISILDSWWVNFYEHKWVNSHERPSSSDELRLFGLLIGRKTVLTGHVPLPKGGRIEVRPIYQPSGAAVHAPEVCLPHAQRRTTRYAGRRQWVFSCHPRRYQDMRKWMASGKITLLRLATELSKMRPLSLGSLIYAGRCSRHQNRWSFVVGVDPTSNIGLLSIFSKTAGNCFSKREAADGHAARGQRRLQDQGGA